MSQSIETGPRTTVRTIVASFLFNDLVGFSKGTAAEQHAAKTRLTTVLRRNLAALPETDYWIKDTGDGALLAFVSNPEHALYMALAIEHDYEGAADAPSTPSNSLRTGLHLGTVKESVDLEGRRNFIGDGINAAKRIMDFAQPGQITASRSFFEAIANLDAAYAALFKHLGAPDDKHGRSHELYAVSPSAAVLEKLRADFAAGAGEAADPGAASTAAAADGASKPAAQGAVARYASPRFLIAVAAALLLGIAAIYYASRQREPAVPPAQPALSPSTAAPSPASVPPPSTEPVKEKAATNPEVTDGAFKKPEPATPPPVPPSAPSETPKAAAASGAASGAKPRPSAPPAITQSGAPLESPRCSRIIEKATLGEPLTPDEKRELANSCR